MSTREVYDQLQVCFHAYYTYGLRSNRLVTFLQRLFLVVEEHGGISPRSLKFAFQFSTASLLVTNGIENRNEKFGSFPRMKHQRTDIDRPLRVG